MKQLKKVRKKLKKKCPTCGKLNSAKKYNSSYEIATRCGTFTILYNIFKCSCGASYYSIADEIQHIVIEDRKIKITPQIASIVTKIGTSARSFEDAERIVKEFGICGFTDTTIAFITKNIGKKVFEDLEQKAKNNYDSIVELSSKEYTVKKGTTMYIEFDGSMLRRIIENGTEWKELKLGVIFIKNSLGKVINKQYISYYGSAEQFKTFLFYLAVNMGYFEMEKVVVLADGAHWIWNICNELFPDAICILDYFHLKENIYEYYNAYYIDDNKKAKKEAKKLIKKIDNGSKIETILKTIPIFENKPDSIVNLPNYIEYHQNRIKYKDYLSNKLDIGSGVIESGNKNVIQHRLKQTGMKWLEDSIKYMATLRCTLFNGLWNIVDEKILDCVPA